MSVVENESMSVIMRGRKRTLCWRYSATDLFVQFGPGVAFGLVQRQVTSTLTLRPPRTEFRAALKANNDSSRYIGRNWFRKFEL